MAGTQDAVVEERMSASLKGWTGRDPISRQRLTPRTARQFTVLLRE